MTATIDLDLSNLLCRYAIDPVTGGIEELEPQDLVGDECGRPGSSPGNQQGGTDSPSDGSTGLPTLPGDIAGSVVDGHRGRRRVARPAAAPGRPGMIARKTKLKLVAFAMLAVLGMSYLGFKYVGLDRVILGSGYDVAADFSNSGGIFVNAEVTYRGVAVGRVTDMQLVDDGVRVTLTIDPDADPIPADTEAFVATRSAVGEQYVDLRPASASEPYLEDGSVIPVENTAIPVPVEQLLLHMDGLVGSIDQDNLRIVVDELGQAFAGAGDDLGRLIDNGDLLLARAEESLPQTLALITDGQTVLTTQVESRSAIQQWAADLRLVTDTLVDMDPTIRELLVNSPDAGAAVQQLVEDAGPGLGLAGPQPRHPQPGHDPAARRRRADAGHLPRRRLRRVHRGPARRRRA